MTELEKIAQIVDAFDEGREALTKFAFTPAAPPAPPMTAGPQGGPPPADPNAMPPGAAPAGPPADPNAMPPADPNAMPPGGAPAGPPPADPNAGGGIPPELENALSQLAGGMDTVSQTVEEQQAQTDQLSQRMLAMEEELNKMKDALKGPAPFEEGEPKPNPAEVPDMSEPVAAS